MDKERQSQDQFLFYKRMVIIKLTIRVVVIKPTLKELSEIMPGDGGTSGPGNQKWIQNKKVLNK